MSIESKIEALTAAVTALTQAIAANPQPTVVGTLRTDNLPLPVPTAAAQVVAPVQPPVTAPVAAAMPALPTFAVPTVPVVEAAPVAKAPFVDIKGLIFWVMEQYKNLGPVKGAQIQNVLAGLGVSNVNDVPSDKFLALYQGVEALKAAP